MTIEEKKKVDEVENLPIEEDEEFDEAFEKAAGVDDLEEPPEKPPEPPESPGEPPEEGDGKEEPEPPDEPGDDWKVQAETYEKRLKDTQAALTKVNQELAEFRKKEREEPKEDEELTDDEKEFLSEAPEIESIVNKKARALFRTTLEESTSPLREEIGTLRNSFSQMAFESSVIGGFRHPDTGKFVDGHADARVVLASPDFQDWYKGEQDRNPSMKDINEPLAAIEILSRFKEVNAKSAAQRHDESLRERGKALKDKTGSSIDETSHESREKSSQSGSRQREAEFDEAFEEASQGL